MSAIELAERKTRGAEVIHPQPAAWALTIPPGPSGQYRLAQVDDTTRLPRGRFIHRTPFRLSLRARVSAAGLPGTWGFGLWNDPFGLGFGEGSGLQLPVLPNAAWFFHASPPNHLALRDTHPADGFLAAVFRSPRVPAVFSLAAAPGLALLLWPGGARWLRRLAAGLIAEDAAALDLDPSTWRCYTIAWEEDAVRFEVDGTRVFETGISPRGRLGVVIWIDNQYAAFPPHARPRTGTLAAEGTSRLEVEGVEIE